MVLGLSKGSAGDARRLRETGSRLRAMMKVKDELLAKQEELPDLRAEKLTNVQAQQLAGQAELKSRVSSSPIKAGHATAQTLLIEGWYPTRRDAAKQEPSGRVERLPDRL
jgi:hypothetical protein